jgi:hypothetical protein
MTDHNAWFESQVANRAMLLTEEEALEGNTLVSFETNAAENGYVSLYIENHFGEFLKHLRYQSPADQSLILSYVMLKKTQSQLAKIFMSTQTIVSFQIRCIMRAVAGSMALGPEPSQPIMEGILRKAGMEENETGVGTSHLMYDFGGWPPSGRRV